MLWKRLPTRLDAARHYAREFGVQPLIARLILNRGVDGIDPMERFLYPRFDRIEDPFTMRGMENAVRRIRRALVGGERIHVHGDYDVDGVSSCAVVVMALRSLNADVHYSIVHRGDSTVGLSLESMHRDHLPSKPGLIITTDCGTTNGPAIELAKQHDIDVIVVDHHQPGARLPKPYALLNPHQPNCSFKFKRLAAVGVAYHLVVALDRFLQKDERAWAKLPLPEYLDIVALGTVADVVPLVDSNRMFVREGLKLIQTARRPGICALMRSARLINEYQTGTSPITTRTIGFRIAPLINAAGRMGDASLCVELLATDSYRVAVQIANQLVKYNTERQKCEKGVLSEALAIAESQIHESDASVIVLAEQGWHPGVLGIVASRLSERLNRPAIVTSIDDYGLARGSVRAPSGYNMLSVLEQCSDLLETWGGHPSAAGLQFRAASLDEFRARANLVLNKTLPSGVPEREIVVDGVIELAELNERTFTEFDLLAPFGAGNPEPVLEIRNVQAFRPKRRGRNVHVELRQNGTRAFGTGFGLGDRTADFGNRIDVLVSPRRNSGRSPHAELYIKDLRSHR